MDDLKQENLKLIERLISKDIAEMIEHVAEPDKVEISLLAVHLMDLECAVETLVRIMKEPSGPGVLDTRSRRWE